MRSMILTGLVFVCAAEAAAGDAVEDVLDELLRLEGNAYIERRNRAMTISERGREFREVLKKYGPDIHERKWMVRVLMAWIENRAEYMSYQAALREMEFRHYSSILLPKNQPPPTLGSRFLEGEKGSRFVPLAMEMVWKGETIRHKEWMKHSAFELIGNYGEPADAAFCLWLVPRLREEEFADAAVDVALALGGQDALKELHWLAGGNDETAKAYQNALERLRVRQIEVNKRLISLSLRIWETPLYKLDWSRPRDIGVLKSLIELEFWEMQWTRQVILCAWEYAMRHRNGDYLAFRGFHGCDIAGHNDIPEPISKEKSQAIITRYKAAYGRQFMPLILHELSAWGSFLDESRKLLLIEMIDGHADATVARPLARLLRKEPNERVAEEIARVLGAAGDEKSIEYLKEEMAFCPKSRLEKFISAKEKIRERMKEAKGQ
ncbi:MAG: hypothetical protein N3A38_04240 [Planctomycetota bacterium]|nr:hypothetical protein [Planctomycetota bacterium]